MNSKIHKELRRIMKSIPPELKDNLTTKVKEAPVLNELYDRVKAEKNPDPEALRKLEMIKRSGYMNREVEIVNEEVAEKIDAWLDEQIQRSIKLGRLPKDDPEYNKFIKKKYGKTIKQVPPLANEVPSGEENPSGDSPERNND